MKTKLDLVELGRQVMIAREAYNMNRPVDGPLKDGWQSDRDIYIGGHLADYVEAKLNERAAGRDVRDGQSGIADVETAKDWVNRRAQNLIALQDGKSRNWWGLALFSANVLLQMAYSIAVYVDKNKTPAAQSERTLVDALLEIEKRARGFTSDDSGVSKLAIYLLQDAARQAINNYEKAAK